MVYIFLEDSMEFSRE